MFKFLFSIHNRYFPALILIALFSIFSYINMTHIIDSMENDGQVINQSGKQRMLSQNLVLLSLEYLNNPTVRNKEQIRENLGLMRNFHKGLMSLEQNSTIKKIYQENDLSNKIDKFLNKTELFLSKSSMDLLNELSADAQELLPLLSYVVKEYELLNRTKVEELKQRQFYILIFTFIILFLELILVFYPTSKKIREYTDELEKLNGSLEQKVKEEVEKNRQKDKQLSQQSRLAQMGVMIDMIAHQWRQPLNSIANLNTKIELDIMFNKYTKDATLNNTNQIANLINYLSHTIDDFREFFKPSKQKNDIRCDEIIQSVLNLVQNSIKTNDIEIQKELLCNGSIFTYENELKQVILSIISNAVYALTKNMVQHPYIKLKSYTQDNMYILEISDNGGGISDDIIDKIFKAHFTTKEQEGGSGLGLYMSKTIIEDHCGGELSVSNTSEGALFKIVIPQK